MFPLRILVALSILCSGNAWSSDCIPYNGNKIGQNDIKITFYSKQFDTFSQLGQSVYERRSVLENQTIETVAFLVHGWSKKKSDNTEHVGAFMDMKDSLLAYYDVVVWFEYWNAQDDHSYHNSVIKAHSVGWYLAQFALNLVNHNGADYDQMHFICFSLGAHVCGYAGRSFWFESGKKLFIRRITALDPGMILITDEDDVCPISPESGKEVIVLHTGMGHGPLGYGMGYMVGTLDFLPNGGESQSKCDATDYVCDHLMALHYFRLSINRPYCYTSILCPGFWDYIYKNCYYGIQTQMGFHADNQVSDGYFARMFTFPQSSYPYCNAQYSKYYGRFVCTGLTDEQVERSECTPFFTYVMGPASEVTKDTLSCMSYDSAVIRTNLVYYSKQLKDSIVINGNLFKDDVELNNYFPTNVEVNSLVVLVHGYGKFDRQSQEKAITSIKDSLLSYYNVVVIFDWWKFTDWHLSNYTFVASKTPGAAYILANFIHKWNKRRLDSNKIHFICHGLGVQVCSYAARHSKHVLNYPIGKIIALDPPSVTLPEAENMCQLSSNDAGIVHAIYTDIKDYNHTGHGVANFYPNNGQNQPLCTNQSNHCNHIMALKYFEASISNPNCFPATPCSSWHEFISGSCDKNNKQYMGFHANMVQPIQGNFYFIPNKFQICCEEAHSFYANTLNTSDSYESAKNFPSWGIMLIVISCLAFLGVILFRIYKRFVHRHYEELI